MASRKFDRDFMLNKVLDCPDHLISDEITDHSRWAVGHTILFIDGGKFYRAYYRVGATECQDETPWEYEEEVECQEVRPVEKTVVVYEVVE